MGRSAWPCLAVPVLCGGTSAAGILGTERPRAGAGRFSKRSQGPLCTQPRSKKRVPAKKPLWLVTWDGWVQLHGGLNHHHLHTRQGLLQLLAAHRNPLRCIHTGSLARLRLRLNHSNNAVSVVPC